MADALKQRTSVPVVDDRIVQLTPPALIGGRCETCGAVAFPATDRCAVCATPSVRMALSAVGRIYSFTIVRIPVPSYSGPVPYGLGVVELEADGVRVASMLTAEPIDALQVGAAVRFELVDVGTRDEPLLSYTYRLETS